MAALCPDLSHVPLCSGLPGLGCPQLWLSLLDVRLPDLQLLCLLDLQYLCNDELQQWLHHIDLWNVLRHRCVQRNMRTVRQYVQLPLMWVSVWLLVCGSSLLLKGVRVSQLFILILVFLWVSQLLLLRSSSRWVLLLT